MAYSSDLWATNTELALIGFALFVGLLLMTALAMQRVHRDETAANRIRRVRHPTSC